MIAAIEMQLFAILAATICGSIGLLCSRPWNKTLRTSSEANYYGHTALGFAAGYMFAFWYIMGEVPSFPAEEAYHSLFYVAGGVAFIAFITSFFASFSFRIIAILILSCFAAMYIMPEWVFEDDDGNLMITIWYWRVGYIIASVALFALMERLQQLPGVTHSLVWFITATGASILIIFAASAKIAQLCGAIAAMSMATGVVCFILPQISLRKGALYFLAIFLPALLLNGYLLGNEKIPAYLFVITCFAPLSLYLLEIPKFKKDSSPIKLMIIRIATVTIVLAITLAIGYQYYK